MSLFSRSTFKFFYRAQSGIFSFRSSSFDASKIEKFASVKQLRELLGAHVSSLKDMKHIEDTKSDHLEPRTSEDSRDAVILPLGSDPQLRDQYISVLGAIRFGLLLEDLDTFAVWLSYRHNQGLKNHGKSPKHNPMRLVTACVDRIDLRAHRIAMDRDIIMNGHVSWVGRSSIEATMHLYQQNDDNKNWHLVCDAKFVMVAIDLTKPKSVANHPLVPKFEQEKKDFAEGERAKALRKEQAKQSLLLTPPNELERTILHDLFLKTIDEDSHTFRHRKLPHDYVWMDECRLKNVIVCHPQQKNLYGKIFGGFLMRSAFELAWANARIFSKSKPILTAVDDIMFRKSVEVGTLLFLSSEVGYTEDHYMQIRVRAEVVRPEEGTQQTTNTFYFTFATHDRKHVHKIMPKTYADGMLYLSAKRHFNFKESQHHA